MDHSNQSNQAFVRGVSKLVSGAVLAQGLTILLSPILSRIFPPDTFGTLAVFVSIVEVLVVIGCLRYELAIMLPEEDQDAAHLLIASLLFAGMIALLSILGILFLADPLLSWLKAPQLKPYLWMVPLATFSGSAYLSLRYWQNRRKAYHLLSVSQVLASGGKNLTQLGSGFAGMANAGGLISGQMLYSIVAAISLAIPTWKDLRSSFSHIRGRRILELLHRYRKFPLNSTWTALLNTMSTQLPTLLLSRYFNPTVVGYYSFGSRVIQLPMTMLGTAIAQVFYQQAAEAQRAGELSRFVQATFQRLISLGLLPFLILTIVGEEAFRLVFGAEWAEAGVLVQIMSLWRYMIFIGSPLSTLFSIFERQEIGLVFGILLFGTRAASLTIGGNYGDARLSLVLYSISGLLLWIAIIIWILRTAKVSFSKVWQDSARFLAYALPVIGLLVGAKWVGNWGDLALLLLSGGGLLLYYGLITGRDPSLRSLFQGILKR